MTLSGRAFALAAVLALFRLPCDAQTSPAVSTIVAARAAVDRGDWKAAAGPLSDLVERSPLDGEFRIDLARAHYYLGEMAKAESDYRIAFDLKAVDPAIAAYGVAKCDARLGKRTEMLTWLGTAVSLGLRRLEAARSDEDFKAYRNDPDFRRLVGLVDAGRMSRVDGWRGDIRFLSAWIERKSFHPFRTATADRIVSGAADTREAFEAAAQKLIADVPKLDDRAIELALFELVARLGDGHSAVWGSPSRAEFGLTLPLGFYLFDDGLYVISAAPAHADLLGARVISIDGTPVAEALARVDPLIGHDNGQWLRAMEPHYLRHVPFLKALGIAKAEGAVDLTVRLGDEAPKTVRVDADVTEPDIWNALPKPAGWVWIGDKATSDFQVGNDKAFWWKWEPDTRLLYVQYNKVENGKDESLAAFAGEVSDAIAKFPVDKLVVDMRNNNGGDTYLNEPLLAAIACNARVNRTGRLFVIIGRRTFSAAMNAASYFGRFTKAIFVGEPTGGKPNAPGDETPFALPYSGIVVNLSDRYWQGSWPDDFSDFRAPEIPVPQTFADYRAGIDPAMRAIVAQPAMP